MSELIYNDEVVQSLSQAIARGEAGLSDVPGLIKMVIGKNLWQQRLVGMSGQVVKFKTFQEFAKARPPEGLGVDTATLERLCRDDKAALDALDRVLRRPHGGDRRSSDFKANNDLLEQSRVSSPTRLGLRRLAAERPDLHAKVLSGEVTVNGAMVAAGFRQRGLTIFPEDIERTVETLRRQLSPDKLTELAVRLAQITKEE